MYARVYVEITNICNLSCSFCHGCNRPPRRMSREEFSLVLDRLAGHTRYLYYHLMGEPLTHPELPAFLRMAAQSVLCIRSIFPSTALKTALRRSAFAIFPELPLLLPRRPVGEQSYACGCGTGGTMAEEMRSFWSSFAPCSRSRGRKIPGVTALGSGCFWNGEIGLNGRTKMLRCSRKVCIATA